MIELKSWTISRTSQGTNIHNQPIQRLTTGQALEILNDELSDGRTQVKMKRTQSILTKQRYRYFGFIPCEDIKFFRGTETEIKPLLDLIEKLTPVKA